MNAHSHVMRRSAFCETVKANNKHDAIDRAEAGSPFARLIFEGLPIITSKARPILDRFCDRLANLG
jgi:hypothetical protein